MNHVFMVNTDNKYNPNNSNMNSVKHGNNASIISLPGSVNNDSNEHSSIQQFKPNYGNNMNGHNGHNQQSSFQMNMNMNHQNIPNRNSRPASFGGRGHNMGPRISQPPPPPRRNIPKRPPPRGQSASVVAKSSNNSFIHKGQIVNNNVFNQIQNGPKPLPPLKQNVISENIHNNNARNSVHNRQLPSLNNNYSVPQDMNMNMNMNNNRGSMAKPHPNGYQNGNVHRNSNININQNANPNINANGNGNMMQQQPRRIVKADPNMKPPSFNKPLPIHINNNHNGHKRNESVSLEYGNNNNNNGNSGWKCSLCTYANNQSRLSCQMCGHDKSAKPLPHLPQRMFSLLCSY